MADTKLSALVQLAATPATGDQLYIQDISEAANDQSKRITVANLLAFYDAVTATMTNKTLSAPVFSGAYSFGGTPTFGATMAGASTFSGIITFSAASGVVISGATGNSLVVDTNVLVVDATNNFVYFGTTTAPQYNNAGVRIGGGIGGGGIRSFATPSTNDALVLGCLVNGRIAEFTSSGDQEAGNITVTSNIACAFNTSSDARLKHSLGLASRAAASSRLSSYNIHDFEWLANPSQKHVGAFAQEVYLVNPEIVTVGGNNPRTHAWGIDYGKFTPDLILGWQSHEARLQHLEQENKALRQELTALRRG